MYKNEYEFWDMLRIGHIKDRAKFFMMKWSIFIMDGIDFKDTNSV